MAFLSLVPSDITLPGSTTGTRTPGYGIGGTGHDLDDLAPEVYVGHKEAVGVGMLPELLHLPHHDLAVEHAEAVDAVDLLAVQGNGPDQLLGRQVKVHVFAEPT